MALLVAMGYAVSIYQAVTRPADSPVPGYPAPSDTVTFDFTYPEEFYPEEYSITRPYVISLADQRDGRLDPFGYPWEAVDKNAILGLFENREFEELTRLLEAFQRNFERDFHYEYRVYRSFDIFYYLDAELAPLLDEWCQEFPGRFPPYYARAKYMLKMSHKSRGTRWAKDTSEEQFEKMQYYVEKSLADIDVALELEPDLVSAYCTLMRIASLSGDMKWCDELLERAIKVSPNNFIARMVFLNRAVPRWGGSYDRMVQVAEEARQYALQNPKLMLLAGYVFRDQGSLNFNKEQFKKALSLYDKALEFGDHQTFLHERARTRLYLGQFAEALEDIEKALYLDPYEADYYQLRSRIRVRQGDTDSALDDLKYANQITQGAAEKRKRKKAVARECLKAGHDLYKESPYRALAYYSSAIDLDEESARGYYARATVYYNMNDMVMAIPDYERAIKRDPRFFEAYKYLDYSLARSNQFDTIIGHWRRFLALEPDHAEALREISGAYYQKGDIKNALKYAQRSCELGDEKACFYVKKMQGQK
jgi:tetratricopeptide (TPR) repeat protein